MSKKVRLLSEQARQLSPHERIALVYDVLDSLDNTDPELDHLWAGEAKDRVEAYRRGETPAKDLKDVIVRYRP